MTTLSSLRLSKQVSYGGTGLDSAEVASLTASVGVTYYNTLDSLPSSGLTVGDRGFVAENQRLYISNGSGWYNAALVNLSPSITLTPDSNSFSITDSATALIITAVGTDSDNPDAGLVNQSFASDSSQYLVNISNDSSVFTFTPLSQDSVWSNSTLGNLADSNTNSFTYTFKYSDGINFASRAITINYNFDVTEPYYYINRTNNGTAWANASLYRLDAYSNNVGQSVAAVTSYNSGNYTWTVDNDNFFDGSHITPSFSGWTSDQQYVFVMTAQDPQSGFDDRGACYIYEYTGSNTGDNWTAGGYYGSYGGSGVQGTAVAQNTIAAGNTNVFHLAYVRDEANSRSSWWYSYNGISAWTEIARSTTANVTRFAASSNKRQTTSTNRILTLQNADNYTAYNLNANH